jgi:hypothetical protein
MIVFEDDPRVIQSMPKGENCPWKRAGPPRALAESIRRSVTAFRGERELNAQTMNLPRIRNLSWVRRILTGVGCAKPG